MDEILSGYWKQTFILGLTHQCSEGLLLMVFLISHFSESSIGQSLHSAEVLQAPSKRPLEKTA